MNRAAGLSRRGAKQNLLDGANDGMMEWMEPMMEWYDNNYRCSSIPSFHHWLHLLSSWLCHYINLYSNLDGHHDDMLTGWHLVLQADLHRWNWKGPPWNEKNCGMFPLQPLHGFRLMLQSLISLSTSWLLLVCCLVVGAFSGCRLLVFHVLFGVDDDSDGFLRSLRSSSISLPCSEATLRSLKNRDAEVVPEMFLRNQENKNRSEKSNRSFKHNGVL